MTTPQSIVTSYNQQLLEALAPYRDKTLSFGCRLKVKDCNGKKHEVTYASDADYAGIVWDNGDTGSYVEEWVIEILGHPPTLADLLRALQDLKEDGYVWNYHTNEKGNLVLRDKDEILVDISLTLTPSQYDERTSAALLALINGD